MGTKNYGSTTLGYLDPDGRNWETTVFEAGKPVLDKELNLQQDISAGARSAQLLRAMPSGWLSDDFLHASSSSNGIFTAVTSANQLRMPSLNAHVNGWLLRIVNTGLPGLNQVSVPAAPAGAGTRRTDLVVLEVWRRLLSPSPDSTGKSPTGRIWAHGNVKIGAPDDLALNYTDDLLDISVGSETTKRVQIQYRIRVLSDVDIFTYPFGLGAPTLFANSVPASAAAPDGVTTAFVYSNQAADGDAGLWRAGDGNPTNSIGSVDGYMYAIPLMAIFRRNTSAFSKNTNQNGAVAYGGASDRPDGLFYDIVDARDVVDLRLGVNPTGWNYAEVLEKNVNLLFDNTLKTEWGLTAIGGGTHGHTVIWADEIGQSTSHGGNGTTTGTTPGANFVGEFDAVRRNFSDRPVYEVVGVKLTQPGGGWASSTSTVNFTLLPIYPYSAFNYAAYASGVIVTDLIAATFIGPSAGKKTFDGLANVAQVSGLGAVPISNVTVKLDDLSGKGVTDEDLYLEFLVCYPAGLGLTYTPTATFGSGSFSINNPASLPNSGPIFYSALANNSIDATHREVQLQYTTSDLTFTMAADSTGVKSSFHMPERVNSIVSVSRNAVPIIGGTTVSADGRTVTFSNVADYTSPGDVLTVIYSALRPLPQNGEQLTIWYEARVPQTIRDAHLGTSLTLIPKYVPSQLYTLTTGSSSQDEGYPFPYAYVQSGGVYSPNTSPFAGDHALVARGATSVSNFSANTGFLKLSTYVPCVPPAEGVTFERAPGDADLEGRTYFPSVSAGGYLPNAYAQDLSDPTKHKVVFPFLAELGTTTSFGVKGQLVLVVLTRWASFDATNGVFFNANLTQNTTAASVFRLKGNLLNRSV